MESDEELDRLYRQHGERLWRAVLAFSGDREVASDAGAEAFAQCLGPRPGPVDLAFGIPHRGG